MAVTNIDGHGRPEHNGAHRGVTFRPGGLSALLPPCTMSATGTGVGMARLDVGARVAVIGAGPGGLVAAKHALEAGFDVTVFEASDDLGGQWNTTAAHSGIWPGMRTNTSRAMTAFSDLAAAGTHELHPFAEQIHAYLRAYADAFGVTERIRFDDAGRRPASRAGGSTASRSTRWSSRPDGSAHR